MSIIEPIQQLEGAPWFFPRNLLIHYFIHCAPMTITKEAAGVAKISYAVGDIDEYILIWTLYSCKDYRTVITCIKSKRGRHTRNHSVMAMYIASLIDIGEREKALRLLKNNNNLPNRYVLVGLEYERSGDYSSALEYYQKHLSIQCKVYGNFFHPCIAAPYNNIGNVHQSQRDYSSALEYYQRNLNMRLKIYSDSSNAGVATSYHNIGCVYESQGDYSTALEYYQKSLHMLLSTNVLTTHELYDTIQSNIQSAQT